MSAKSAEMAYHFDRNAFAAAARAGDVACVALTDSGNLLAFDPSTYALLAERVPRSPVACLSAAGGDVVAGLDDGRIVSVEVPSLKMKSIGAVEATGSCWSTTSRRRHRVRPRRKKLRSTASIGPGSGACPRRDS